MGRDPGRDLRLAVLMRKSARMEQGNVVKLKLILPLIQSGSF